MSRLERDKNVTTGQERTGEESSLSKKSKKTSQTNSVFVAPTVELVREYCHDRSNTVDAEQFVDYYTARGWMLNGRKMKDWQAALRTWEKNAAEKSKPRYSSEPAF